MLALWSPGYESSPASPLLFFFFFLGAAARTLPRVGFANKLARRVLLLHFPIELRYHYNDFSPFYCLVPVLQLVVASQIRPRSVVLGSRRLRCSVLDPLIGPFSRARVAVCIVEREARRHNGDLAADKKSS